MPRSPRAGGFAPALAALALVAGLAAIGGCAGTAGSRPVAASLPPGIAPPTAEQQAQAEADALLASPLDARRVDRITGGVNAALLQQVARLGYARWLDQQLHPGPAQLPTPVAERIAAWDSLRQPLAERVRADAQQRRAADQLADEEQKQAARKAYQQGLNRQADEADQRWMLQAVNSPNQVQERMVWFWVNHFSIGKQKANLRAFVGDYEATLRPLALGHFRDLLAASAFHPAMLRYLDNERNAAGQINENYAREIMELHTLGVDAGYSQRDVQELARVLTGLGVREDPGDARVRPQLAAAYVHQGLFEFNPARHDAGDKALLGQTVHGGGLEEVKAVLDRLARDPATAHHLCTQLAEYFVGDHPPPALVERLARRYLETDGDIAAVLKLLFTAPEFDASLGTRFKDPWQYVVSAARLAYDGSPVLDAQPLLVALRRLDEVPFGRATPDGWPLAEDAWNSPGQMTARFEVARLLVGGDGRGNSNLFRTDPAQPPVQAPRARVASAAWQRTQADRASAATREALADALANHPGQWAWVALVSPEFMRN